MPVPEPDYFTVEEIAGRWEIPVAHLERILDAGKLVPSVLVSPHWTILMACGGGLARHTCFPSGLFTVKGFKLAALIDGCLCFGIHSGPALVQKGVVYTPTDEVLEIEKSNLLITREERDRFEAEHDVRPMCASRSSNAPGDPKAVAQEAQGERRAPTTQAATRARQETVAKRRLAVGAALEALQPLFPEWQPDGIPYPRKAVAEAIKVSRGSLGLSVSDQIILRDAKETVIASDLQSLTKFRGGNPRGRLDLAKVVYKRLLTKK